MFARLGPFNQRAAQRQRGRRIPRLERAAQAIGHVVRVIGQAPDPIGRRQAQGPGVLDPDLDRAQVGQPGLAVATDPVIGVAGHVDQVAGVRGQARQLVGIGFGPACHPGDFRGMDVEVDRTGVVGVPLEHGFQQGHGQFGIDPPVLGIPGFGHQPGIGRHDRDLVILGVAGGQGRHGLGEGQVPRLATAPVAIAQTERTDQGALAVGSGRGRQRGGLVDHGDQGLQLGLGLAVIDRRTRGPGLAPQAHRAGRIEPHRLGHGRDRRLVRESVGQLHAIVEEGLGLRHPGGDRESPRPVTRQDLGHFRGEHVGMVHAGVVRARLAQFGLGDRDRRIGLHDRCRQAQSQTTPPDQPADRPSHRPVSPRAMPSWAVFRADIVQL